MPGVPSVPKPLPARPPLTAGSRPQMPNAGHQLDLLDNLTRSDPQAVIQQVRPPRPPVGLLVPGATGQAVTMCVSPARGPGQPVTARHATTGGE